MKKLIFMLIILLHLNSSEENEPKLLLITGCGRSGTEFMATFLKDCGLDINHEKPGLHGCISWPMTENYYSPWGPISNDHFYHVFHQVRHPLAVITSWMVNLNQLDRDEWCFIRSKIPEIKEEDSLVVHCAKYWYYWNIKTEKISEWRYQIEAIDKHIEEFEKRLGVVLDKDLLKQMPRNINSWQNTSQKITWKFLEENLSQDLYDKVNSLAQKYGYIDDSLRNPGKLD